MSKKRPMVSVNNMRLSSVSVEHYITIYCNLCEMKNKQIIQYGYHNYTLSKTKKKWKHSKKECEDHKEYLRKRRQDEIPWEMDL